MRQTNDADIAIQISGSELDSLVSAFNEPYHLSMSALAGAIVSQEEFRSTQLIHMNEAFKVDLFVLGAGAYENSELDRAIGVAIIPGAVVQISAAETVVLAKLRWFLLGKRISDRQWNDIVSVLEIQSLRRASARRVSCR
jgi:hypothetical protein